jgi:hypothetical protein
MTEPVSRPADIFKLYQDMFANQQNLLPSSDVAIRLMAAGRHVMDAQWAFTQALMHANAELFAAWAANPAAQQREDERPSVAAKQNEVMTA